MARRAGWLGIGIALLLSTAATALADAGDDDWYAITGGGVDVAKFTPTGDVVWSARTGSLGDRAVAIETDTANGATVAVDRASGGPALVKYNAAGALLWAIAYARADIGGLRIAAMARDGEGNVVTIGESAAGKMQTVKVLADGSIAWAKEAVSPASPHAATTGTRVAVGEDGGVFAVGEAYDDRQTPRLFAAAYLPDGEPAWWYLHAPDDPASGRGRIAPDGYGGAFIAGAVAGAWDRLVVLHLDATGTATWTADRRLTDDARACLGYSIGPEAVRALPDGGVVVAGGQSIGDSCWFAEALDAAGSERWSLAAPGSSHSQEAIAEFAANPVGEVVGVGSLFGFARSFLTRTVGASGELGWTQVESDGDVNVADAVAVDEAGNVAAVGYGCGWDSYIDIEPCFGDLVGCSSLLARYGPQGERLWSAAWRPGGTDYFESQARDVALDADGNLVVAGESCQYRYETDGGGGGGDDGYEDDDNDDFDWPSDDDAGKKKHSGGGCAVGDGNALTLVTLMLAIGGMAWLESRRRLGRR